MESILVEQTPTTPIGRWILRGVALALIGGLLLAGFFLFQRGGQSVSAMDPPAPVTLPEIQAEAVAAPPVQSIPLNSAAESRAESADTDAQASIIPADSLQDGVAETVLPAAASPFPVLEGFAFQPEDWLVVRDVPPGEDPENPALGGELAVFALQPLAAPCCPLPTSDKAVDAARGLPGVLAAKVNDAGQMLVRYDPAQTTSEEIAAAVNKASFIVQIVETNE